MKIKKIITLCVALCIVLGMATGLSGCGSKEVPTLADVYVTTGTMSKLLARQTTLKFTEYGEDQEFSGVSLTVNTDKKGQEFYGFGASLTHSAAYLLTQEGAKDTADEILQELFGADGARLNMIRVPIGASDYIEGSEYFSCCDKEDPSLNAFTVEKDKNIIAVLKKILAINPDVTIFAVPWSAPAWMKTNNSLEGGTLKEEYYETYADYLVKFVEAYKAEGIEIHYLSLINEPLITNCGYPHMSIDELQAVEIGRALSDRLKEKKLSVSLLGWEHNVDDMAYSYLETVYGDGSDLFAGAALHGYGKDYTVTEGVQYLKEIYAKKQVFMTELTEHTGSNDFASNLSYAAKNVTVDPVNYGLNGAMFWNLVLRPDGSPTPVRHGNECYGVMDLIEENGRYSYFKRSAYYAMAQISKFAYAIDGENPTALEVTSSNDSQILACALRRADGVIVVAAVNISDQLSETVHAVIDGQCVSYELPPQSVVTFVC